ncbi:hypothetical protein T492DRAFT_927231 [Pavlovales sp. CCMP2436]|nr:hypothetical protein T492DRAFT_927231 [Pavlovales sp. CCMP2436]
MLATRRCCATRAASNVSDQSGASACRSASRHHATSPRGPLAGVNGHAKVVRRRFFLIVDLLRAQQRRRVSRRRGRMCQSGSFGPASRREPAEVPRRSAAARAARVSMEASWGPSFNRGTRRSTLAPEVHLQSRLDRPPRAPRICRTAAEGLWARRSALARGLFCSSDRATSLRESKGVEPSFG